MQETKQPISHIHILKIQMHIKFRGKVHNIWQQVGLTINVMVQKLVYTPYIEFE